MKPSNYNNNQPGKIHPRVQQGHIRYKSNQMFPDWIRPVPQEATHALISPKGEPTTFSLINGHSIKLTSKYAFLHPWINEAPNPHETSFLVKWMVFTTETHNWSNTKNNIHNVVFSYNGISISHALTIKLREHHKRGGRTNTRARGQGWVGDGGENSFWARHGHCTQELTVTVVSCTSLVQGPIQSPFQPG